MCLSHNEIAKELIMNQNCNNRQFKKLRVSLVGNCNFACAYCVPEKSNRVRNIALQVSPEKFCENILRIHRIVNLESVRLTGGEPTLYKELPKLIYMLKKSGIPKVSITTNGRLLKKLHRRLIDSGLDNVNVSLDSLDEEIFKKINRTTNVSYVLKGIESILNTGIEIKINSTIMKGFNDNQILPILDWAMDRNIIVRYLELMKMGHLFYSHSQYYFSEEEILNTIQSKYELAEVGREKSSTCNYWQISNGMKVGIISNHSKPFCSDCDRLRIDQFGNIYGCLSVNTAFPMEASDTHLRNNLLNAMQLKRDNNFSGSSISMQAIGG
jgi:cyclic pyranopterin phosphate synthase